ncbi:hypothetical protein DdX_17137 [Ditylenchus destructor]|uniref:Uncharacterized protein n=1 Tax=Ditylenchus destructor TaxID=166010 RepID=A0AAD4QTL7_9BILA|nr:hypothetical protein DdX_17137 [Ditylenchus destructor]
MPSLQALEDALKLEDTFQKLEKNSEKEYPGVLELKAIEAAFQREAKEMKTRNAKSRLEELRGITKKSSPIEYKRIGDKYVLRGVEENLKLMNIKNKKIDELNENARMLRAKLNDRIEKTVNRAE